MISIENQYTLEIYFDLHWNTSNINLYILWLEITTVEYVTTPQNKDYFEDMLAFFTGTTFFCVQNMQMKKAPPQKSKKNKIKYIDYYLKWKTL